MKISSLLIFLNICAFIITACSPDYAVRKEQADTYTSIGIAHIEAGNYNGALKEFLTAESFTPEVARIHYLLALTYKGKGYDEKALDECKTAIKLKDNYSEAYNLLGTIYLDRGLNDPAIEAFNKALENILYETPSMALYHLGRAYYNKGEYPKALSKYQEAAIKNMRGELLPLIENGMGKVNYAQGDIAGAVSHFSRSVELAPSYAESYYLLGECQMKQGKVREAKKAFESVVKIAPNLEFGKKAKEYLNKMRK
ncbi:MAG: tetratricopeptide repeat protein [Syntrophales bacterium]|nr:tetratricopeptide repeat protein [Syntrophales bacterium]